MKILRISLPVILLLICLLGVAVTVFTQNPAATGVPSSEVAAEITGKTQREDSVPQVTPPRFSTTAADAKVAARMDTRSADLQIVTHPDGRSSVHLGGRFAHTSAMVRAPDGSLVVQCFSDPEAMAAALAGAEKAQPAPALHR